jgi:hypothetical protein
MINVAVAGGRADAWDKIDTDKLVEHYGDTSGIPPDIIRPQEEVDEIRIARAEQQKAQALAEQASKLAPAAKDLSETDTTQPSALTDVMQMAGAGGI